MRRMTVLVAGFAALVGGSLLLAQQPMRPGGGGGRVDAVNLVRNPQVQKELGLTEEQLEKIPDSLLKALADVLDEKQLKRLKQIDLQQRGTSAFYDARIQKELKVTEEQKATIAAIEKEAAKERAELFKGKGGFAGGFEKMKTLNKETAEKIQEALTVGQRKAYKQMLGEEFKLENRGFGFTPGGDPKKKIERPKNDN